jgi:hypothetical protein
MRWENIRLTKGHEEEAPRAGTSDVAVGQLKKQRILAAVEPGTATRSSFTRRTR